MTSSAVKRNWVGYICESLVASGSMATWDAT